MKIMDEICPKCGKNDKWRYNRQWCHNCDTKDFHHMDRLVRWHVPNGEEPVGNMLVVVDTNEGSDCALVYIDHKNNNTLLNCENGDIWTLWTWKDVSRYAMLEDILVV